jgi:glutathione S-transferase
MDLLDLSYDLKLIDRSEEGTQSDAYRALNPFGTVPTLLHGDRVILESGAQMMYLADLVPEKAMAPEVGTPERATYYEWFVLNGATLEPLGTAGFQNPDNPDARAGMNLAMTVLQDRLEMPFAMGLQFTAVDVLIHWQLALLHQADMLRAMKKASEYYHGLASTLDWTGY